MYTSILYGSLQIINEKDNIGYEQSQFHKIIVKYFWMTHRRPNMGIQEDSKES